MKILVTKFKSIGDVLLVTPLLKNLSILYPDSKIDLVLKEGTSDLIDELTFINKIFFIKSHTKILSKFFDNLKLLLKLRSRDYSIFIGTDRGERTAIFSLFSGANIRIGRKNELGFLYKKSFTNYFSFHGERHTLDLNLDPIRILNKKVVSRKILINNPLKYHSKISKYLPISQEFIHIHPVSQCAYKSVSNELMAKIIDFCEIDLNYKTVLTASKSNEDIDRINDITNLCESKPINLCGMLSLNEVSALNSLSKLLIVLDTAIMHISTANNIPVIAFFGPTSANNWGPLDGEISTYSYKRKGGVQHNGIHTIISSNDPCVPCSQSGCQNSGISNCLNNLNFDLIKRQILRSLRNDS